MKKPKKIVKKKPHKVVLICEDGLPIEVVPQSGKDSDYLKEQIKAMNIDIEIYGTDPSWFKN